MKEKKYNEKSNEVTTQLNRYYAIIDNIIYFIFSKTAKTAQAVLDDNGVPARILPLVEYDGCSYLKFEHYNQLMLDIGIPLISGSNVMLEAHRKLDERLPNIHPSNQLIMLGNLTEIKYQETPKTNAISQLNLFDTTVFDPYSYPINDEDVA